MKFLPHHYKNGNVFMPHKSKKPMSGGIIAGDIDLAKKSSGKVFDRMESNSKLQNIGSNISKLNEKMKQKQNLVF